MTDYPGEYAPPRAADERCTARDMDDLQCCLPRDHDGLHLGWQFRTWGENSWHGDFPLGFDVDAERGLDRA